MKNIYNLEYQYRVQIDELVFYIARYEVEAGCKGSYSFHAASDWDYYGYPPEVCIEWAGVTEEVLSTCGGEDYAVEYPLSANEQNALIDKWCGHIEQMILDGEI